MKWTNKFSAKIFSVIAELLIIIMAKNWSDKMV